MPSNLEVRKYEGRASLGGSADRSVIRGHAIVFNEPSLIIAPWMAGGFREIIRPEAIRRTFDEGIDLRAFIDHDSGRVLGRLSARTLRTAIDKRGLYVEIEPEPRISGHADLLLSIERRDITGMSFQFETILPDGEEWNGKTTPPTRYVKDMRVFEVSVVALPAYEQTDVQVAMRARDRALGLLPSVSQLREQSEARAAGWAKKKLVMPRHIR